MVFWSFQKGKRQIVMLSSEKINYDLTAKVLSGEATSSDFAAHEQWLAADPLHQEEWEQMVHTWNAAVDAIRFEDVDVDGAWHQVKQQMKPKVQQAWFLRPVYQRVAAILVVLLAAVSVIWLLNPAGKMEYKEMMVYSQSGEDVVLPDGSVVSLSAGSSLTFTSPFKPDSRFVNFSGEAFFQIEGNPNWPFIIETNELTIRVIGTAFNVRSWPHQSSSYVDVSHGLVDVSSKTDGSTTIQLSEGHRAAYNRKSRMLEKSVVDPNFLSWKTRQIEFQNASLNQVFETLENVYKVKIVVSDASILEERMGATFSHNTLNYITNVVCATFDLEVSEENDVLVFIRKKS